nr:hypothetical protein [Streptomyces turgidiscabies]
MDDFGGAGSTTVYAGGAIPKLDTVVRDGPNGPVFIDAEAQLIRYRTLAQCSTLQGGGVGHPEPSGPEGRSGTAKVALSDNVVGGPTAGLAGRQACGDLVRPPSGGRGR